MVKLFYSALLLFVCGHPSVQGKSRFVGKNLDANEKISHFELKYMGWTIKKFSIKVKTKCTKK